MVIPAAVGALLILVGLVLLVVDLAATNHGLPAAGGIVMLLVGGSALLWAGVPYSGVLLGAIMVLAVLMGVAMLYERSRPIVYDPLWRKPSSSAV